MVHSPSKRLAFRRRREARTDYRNRLALLKAHKPRAVVRCSNSQTLVQLIRFTPQGDRVLASALSKQLREYGWEGGLANLPAAYLTGLLAGRRALAGGVTEAVLDIGLAVHIPGSKVYAALQGLVEAGLLIPHGETVLPTPERLAGQHLADPKAVAAQMAKVKAALEKL